VRVVVTGAGGLLGGRLAELLAHTFDVLAWVRSSSPPAGLPSMRLDLSDEGRTETALREARAEAVVHCAAFADADRCEHQPDEARRANVDVPRLLARLCRHGGVRLIALSTDLVFDGRNAGSAETDAATPILCYGRTKLEGEVVVLDEAPDAAVVRVPLVVGRGHGPRATASEAIAHSLAAGQAVRLFSDQFRTPADPESIADGLARLLVGGQRGRFHLGGPERLSRLELGRRVARVLGLPSEGILGLRQFETPIGFPRPADVSLDSGRARRELAWEPRPLDVAIREGRLSRGA